MDPRYDLEAVTGDPDRLRSGGESAPGELAETLARLVWETFSDFLVDPAARKLLVESGVAFSDEVPEDRAAEELLILHLWANTRAVQLSFIGRAPDHLVRETLDRFHGAVFADMVTHGTPRHHIPVFEQRVSARYAEYHRAAEVSDERVGEVALTHLAEDPDRRPAEGARLLAERAVEVAGPLRDYLDEVRLHED